MAIQVCATSLRAKYWRSWGRILAGLMSLAMAASHSQVLSAKDLRPFVEVVMPEGMPSAITPLPVVLFLQGTGGGNIRAELWTGWFNALGVATVLIDNAKARGLHDLSGVQSYNQSRDIAAALELLKDDARLDWSRYAIMGFSRGATAALEAGDFLKSDQPVPQFVFSLYPGNNGRCPNSHHAQTKVLVLYGDLDDWGAFQGNRDACERMARSDTNASFHLIAGAHHGFDDMVNAQWSCCGQSFTSKSSANATKEARQIIQQAIRGPWLNMASKQ